MKRPFANRRPVSSEPAPRFRSRAIPQVGAAVVVLYLATQIPGTVVAVDADHRGLEVELEDSERVRFELMPATGTFRALDSSRARLLFA